MGPSPSPPPTPTPTQTGDKTGAIEGNHGHVATITSAQLTAAGAVTINIEGTADHNHTVELSPDQVSQVAAGARVTKTSSAYVDPGDEYESGTNRHDHTVTFN